MLSLSVEVEGSSLEEATAAAESAELLHLDRVHECDDDTTLADKELCVGGLNASVDIIDADAMAMRTAAYNFIIVSFR